VVKRAAGAVDLARLPSRPGDFHPESLTDKQCREKAAEYGELAKQANAPNEVRE
jgi:hypothetical protein